MKKTKNLFSIIFTSFSISVGLYILTVVLILYIFGFETLKKTLIDYMSIFILITTVIFIPVVKKYFKQY